MKNTLKLLMAH
jgi:hypothetical protein